MVDIPDAVKNHASDMGAKLSQQLSQGSNGGGNSFALSNCAIGSKPCPSVGGLPFIAKGKNAGFKGCGLA
jgi:hypothetical protein